jgi:hypothetical protein
MDFEGIGHFPVEVDVLFLRLPRGTEENHEISNLLIEIAGVLVKILIEDFLEHERGSLPNEIQFCKGMMYLS